MDDLEIGEEIKIKDPKLGYDSLDSVYTVKVSRINNYDNKVQVILPEEQASIEARVPEKKLGVTGYVMTFDRKELENIIV